MNHIKLCAAAALLLFSAACKKDKKTTPEPEKEQPVVLKSVIITHAGMADSLHYYYDAQGRCTSYHEYDYTGEITYTANTAVEVVTRPSGPKEKFVYYMRKEMLPDSILYLLIGSDGKEQRNSLTVIQYGADDKPLSGTVKDANGTLRISHMLTWKDDNMVEEAYAFPTSQGMETGTRTFTYDEAGNNTIKVNRPMDGRSYDKLSKNPVTVYTKDGHVIEEYSYEYDEKGRIVKKTINDGRISTYLYE